MEVRLGPLWKEREAGAASPCSAGERPTVFLLLSSLCLAFLLLLLWVIFYLLEPRMSSLGGRFVTGASVVFVAAGLAAVVLVAMSFVSALTRRRTGAHWQGRAFAMRILLPMAERAGRVFGISPDRVRASFIQFSNAVVRAEMASRARGMTRDVLLLLPHCLQSSECSRVLFGDVLNCGGCGCCVMSELKQLVPRYRVRNRIVGGGASALNAVRELGATAVVGVACERELVPAMRELGKIPVISLPNSRPEGPCRNTKVDAGAVEEALRVFVREAEWPRQAGTRREEVRVPHRFS